MLNKVKEKFEPSISVLSARFNHLDSRDQKALSILAIVVALGLVYALIWLPVHQNTEQAEKNRDSKKALVEWMQTKEIAARAVGQGNKTADTKGERTPLLSLVNRAAKKKGIPLKRYEPDGNNKLRVWVENVSFNSLVLWIQHLESRHNIKIGSLSLENPEKNGVVSAKLVMVR